MQKVEEIEIPYDADSKLRIEAVSTAFNTLVGVVLTVSMRHINGGWQDLATIHITDDQAFKLAEIISSKDSIRKYMSKVKDAENETT